MRPFRIGFAAAVVAACAQVCPASDPPAAPPAEVTFAEHVAPLVFQNCAGCHRPGQVAPFSLLSYADVRKHSKTMLRATESRYMPPWQPEPGHGEFRGARRLTDEQIALLAKWVEAGMPEGDSAKTPPIPAFPAGWQLGEPDIVLTMDRPFAVPASGPDLYRNFVFPLALPEDRWVTAVEFRASAPAAIHHALYFLDDGERGRAKAAATADGQPGFPGMGFRPSGMLGGWAVGATPVRLPGGLARPMPKGSDFVLQAHFHPTGKVESETITVGIYLAQKPPARTLVGVQLPPAFGLFAGIDIPAGAADFKVADEFTLPVDVELVLAGGHAHYLAKTLRATAVLPGGAEEPLFYIRDWDFNWQGQYLYKEFVPLPKGTVIRGEVTWDNSDANPRNPTKPPVRVRWGEKTDDEMGMVGVQMVPARESDAAVLKAAVKAHTLECLARSQRRGDRIDFKRLGLDPAKELRDSLLKSKPAGSPLSLRDLDGKMQTPLDMGGAKASVVFVVSADCPISNGYAPEIAAIAREYAGRGVKFYAAHADPDLTAEAARKHAADYGLAMPVLLDPKHELIRAVGAAVTPEVAVVAPGGSVAYLGRIDDRHAGLGKSRPTPTKRDLRDALEAVLAGSPVPAPRTEAVGCALPPPGR